MLTIQSVTKRFGSKLALDSVSFEVAQGETAALLGPSGCGKSTLLAIIAGLLDVNSGSVLWNGEDLDSTPPHKRGFGLMFQDFALFPHMNVTANIAFGLKMAQKTDAQIKARVAETLELTGLQGFEQRAVETLSGGEQQRVALARALAPHPRLLMLDEPLGALDRALREELLGELQRILQTAGQTTIYVTHDQAEAFSIADRVIVMQTGRIAQTGTPQIIYQQPASAFVARFVGLVNILHGKVIGRLVRTPAGDFDLADEMPQDTVQVLLRPEGVRLGAGGKYTIQGTLKQARYMGSRVQAAIQAGEVNLSFDFPAETGLPANGSEITLSFGDEQLQFLDS